jgi:hypothetical protein
MASVSGGANYMSDGAIMAWLETQQDRLYGDLRDSMRSSEARAQFADELNDIKAALHAANSNPEHDFTKVDEQLQAFMQTYAEDPEFAELCGGLQELVNRIHDDTSAQLEHARKQQAYTEVLATAAAQVHDAGSWNVYHHLRDSLKVDDIPAQTYSDDALKTWDELIGGKLDVANKNDQLTMIHIQQLKATIDQGSQFGSQYIASGDKTSNSIINNIA